MGGINATNYERLIYPISVEPASGESLMVNTN